MVFLVGIWQNKLQWPRRERSLSRCLCLSRSRSLPRSLSRLRSLRSALRARSRERDLGYDASKGDTWFQNMVWTASLRVVAKDGRFEITPVLVSVAVLAITTAAPTSAMRHTGGAGSTVVCRCSWSCPSTRSWGSSRRRRVPTFANRHLVRVAAPSASKFTTGVFTLILSKLLNPRLHLVLVPNLALRAAEEAEK